MLKLIMCVKRRAHLTREEFDHYWRNQHASLVVKHSERLGIRKYIQTVPFANNNCAIDASADKKFITRRF